MSRASRHLVHVLLSLVAGHASAQALLCTEDAAAGFVFDKQTKSWVATTAKPSHKYVVRKSSNSLAKLEIGELGTKAPVAFCESDFEQEQVRCRGYFQEFFINRSEMRFTRIYYAGYWNESSLKELAPGRKEGDDSPSVFIGTCTGI